MAAVEIRGPARYLWWLALRLKGRVALGAMFGSLWFASLAFTPYLLSQAIDRGLAARRPGALIAWTAAVLLVGAAERRAGDHAAPLDDEAAAGRRAAHRRPR